MEKEYHTFKDFDVDPRCLRVLDAEGIETPTPIQAQAIPPALEGHDILGIAQTGTGKTLAFTLPALTRLARGKLTRNLMLVLAPTRELTDQVYQVVRTVGDAMKIRPACIYGGVGYQEQNRDLDHGCPVIVATPGRLLDHMQRGNIDFRQLEILVLDEADRMLDMGFLPDIRRILSALPRDRQTLMFSATFPREINRLSEEFMRDPVRIEVGQVFKPVEKVRQLLYTVRREDKVQLLMDLFEQEQIDSALVFSRTKSRTERVTKALRKAGLRAKAIHGDRTQKQRQQALEGFRNGEFPILVATDVAARGLDIQGITHVINYDIPENPDDYIHRIGRTARADAEGDAFTFVCPDEHIELDNIERNLGRNIPRADWDRSVPVLSLYHPPEDRAGRRRIKSRRIRARGLLRRR